MSMFILVRMLCGPNETVVHGLHSQSPEIVDADPIYLVWKQFRAWLDLYLQPDDGTVLVTLNGKTCDLTWLWQLTRAPSSTLSFPPQLKYFLDLLKVIGEYSRCPLHKSRSKLESLELGCVWKVISGDNLNGTHNSLVDVQAQTDIVTSKYLIDFIDLIKSICSINDITKTED